MKIWAGVSISACGVIAMLATLGFYSGNLKNGFPVTPELRHFPSNLDASSKLPYDVDEERVK